MRSRSATAVVLAFVICATFFPACAQDATGTGTLVARLLGPPPASEPVAGALVRICPSNPSQPTQPWTYLTTDEKGEAHVSLAAGSYTLDVGNSQLQTTVQAGQTTTVDSTLPSSGVLVNLHKLSFSSEFLKSARGSTDAQGSDARILFVQGSGVWLSPVPQNATTVFLHFVRPPDIHGQKDLWLTLPLPAQRGSVTVIDADFVPSVPMSFVFNDVQGAPLANLAVTLETTYETQVENPSTFATSHTATQHETISWKTDATGHLNFGRWVAGRYMFQFRAGLLIASDVTVNIDADGKVTPQVVTLTPAPRRTIRQRACDFKGASVPNAVLHASYYDGSVWKLRDTTADANGWAIWTDVPPARIITWGSGIPAGVIDEFTTVVNDPLPPPQPVSPTGPAYLSYHVWLRLPITEPTKVVDCFNLLTEVANRNEWIVEMLTPSGTIPGSDCVQRAFVPGQVAPSIFLYLPGPPIRFAEVPSCYYPFPSANGPIHYDLTLMDAPTLAVRFQDAAGQPVQPRDVRIVPGKGHDLSEARWLACAGNVFPQTAPSGGMGRSIRCTPAAPQLLPGQDGLDRVSVPEPGAYRLLVDLYGEDVPAPPSLILDVKPGENTFTVTLPAPLLTAEPRTTISWISREQPSHLHTWSWGETANRPENGPVPVFGDAASLLALWYRPDLTHLVVHDYSHGAADVRVLQRVSRTLTLATDVKLYPGMPATIGCLFSGPLPVGPDGPGLLETSNGDIVPGTPLMQSFWGGTYVLTATTAPVFTTHGSNIMVQPVDLTGDKPDVTVTLQPPAANPVHMVKFLLPRLANGNDPAGICLFFTDDGRWTAR